MEFSCELLSKECIFDIIDNLLLKWHKGLLLWIAFKRVYLWYYRQPAISLKAKASSCELLSKECIFDIIDNRPSNSPRDNQLWIAFKRVYLWYYRQQVSTYLLKLNRLWIAFKRVYLWYYRQQQRVLKHLRLRCELLSKECIFDIIDNISQSFV